MPRPKPASIPDPIPELKRQLANEIRRLLADHHQFVAAMILGVDQPRMSDIQHGKLERFSLEKLTRLLVHIDCRVTIGVASMGAPRIRCRSV
ncbi:MAG TPA: XRE family transcriptional regulator [Gemmatimonadaceae bacterium]|nr:XRE family transcriptional regulator [Gemmatimonadaceae bacterium]